MREIIGLEVFSPGDMTQYHMMLVKLGRTYVVSVLNMKICFHFPSGAYLEEGYVKGKLGKHVNPCTVTAMLCWLEQQGLPDVRVYYDKPDGRENYGFNKHPEMNEYAETVL